ncbi:glycoside hydrolase 43 family protein [Paenibacillus sp. PR3]|uniref:Glycoside hydrolase 43 family protein n=1 Tax=Paenibacillus terricola TaxID=2763503 RepID=A0ABR8MV63_9BACL|nr:glycoside hydrolase 43 family protein [Paenibacillus terricola]MBD3919842.1 glycoside hydrolase 43 family protein [Paenibacillus terricola]
MIETATMITNPIIWSDVPDPSVIRVGDVYYMSSTSMHSMPGCPIMKSEDLMHWELMNYTFDTFEDNEMHNLADGKHIYGKGSWATSLRHHDGTFYLSFSSLDTNRFYVYQTKDIENGPWERHVIQGLHHDPSLLFDDDGRVYVFHGNGSIRIAELTSDATALKPDGINQLLLEGETEGIGLRAEGCHAYKLNGCYYLFFIEWPRTGNGRRRQVCYRSHELLGPYEHRIVLDDHMGYQNNGVAQGGLVDAPNGEWYAMLFQDHGAVGRIPCIVPVSWEDDWPVFGIDGKVPETFEVPLPQKEAKPLVISDSFEYGANKLALNWQWNHNPDNALWSVTERPGYLRLTTGYTARSVELARNTLTQRTEGPACSGVTRMELGGMKPGDRAGLVALQHFYGTVGILADVDNERYVAMCVKGENGEEVAVEKIRYEGDHIYLRIDFNFAEGVDLAHFHYSADGLAWHSIGYPLQMKYMLQHFMGYRIGLFNYATKNIGGHVDFEFFEYEKSV